MFGVISSQQQDLSAVTQCYLVGHWVSTDKEAKTQEHTQGCDNASESSLLIRCQWGQGLVDLEGDKNAEEDSSSESPM